MATNQAAEDLAAYAFLGLTAVTGLVDAVSFLPLGWVFTANMTGVSCFSALRRSAYPAVPDSFVGLSFVNERYEIANQFGPTDS